MVRPARHTSYSARRADETSEVLRGDTPKGQRDEQGYGESPDHTEADRPERS